MSGVPRKGWERIADALGPGVVDALAALSASELTALLLEVRGRRVPRVTPAHLRRQYANDAFVAPAPLDQREALRFDLHVLSRIPAAFTALELSPLAPEHVCAALGPVHPNNVLGTMRGTDVSADCTNVLALEAARRRDQEPVVRLCTSQRLVRAQRVTAPGLAQHFRLAACLSAGRDPGGRRFEEEALLEHLGVWIRLLRDLPAGWQADVRSVTLSAEGPLTHVADRVTARLVAEHGVTVRRDDERFVRSRYYRGLAFKLDAAAPSGAVFPLGDGGLVDWVAKIRGDRKERTFISAVGTELVMKLFRSSAGG